MTIATQLTFDDVAAAQARADGMERADKHAEPGWKELALEAVRQTALAHETFTVDDVWVTEPGLEQYVMQLELRAMGPVLTRAKKEGWIEATGNFRTGARVSIHGNPRRVWRSLIHGTGSSW